MTTRPILKSRNPPKRFPPMLAALPLVDPPHSPHVHFPPTPILTSTYTTHSPFAYDRAPIVVSPNVCALPERGGRVYTPPAQPHTTPKGCYFHPRAPEACEREVLDEHLTSLSTPALIPDLSSSSSEASDDSEVYNHPPSSSIPMIPINSSKDFTYPLSQLRSPEELGAALSFLPYPSRRAKGRRKPKKRGTGDSFRSVTSELPIEGCLGGF